MSTKTTNVINPANTPEKLKTGDVLIIGAKQTKNYAETSKVTLEWAEKMPSSATGRRKMTAVQLLNQSDERFNSGAQRCWESYTTADVKEFLGIDTSPNAEGIVIISDKSNMKSTFIMLHYVALFFLALYLLLFLDVIYQLKSLHTSNAFHLCR